MLPLNSPHRPPPCSPKAQDAYSPKPHDRKEDSLPGGRLVTGAVEQAFLFGGPGSESPSKSGESPQCQVGPTDNKSFKATGITDQMMGLSTPLFLCPALCNTPRYSLPS